MNMHVLPQQSQENEGVFSKERLWHAGLIMPAGLSVLVFFGAMIWLYKSGNLFNLETIAMSAMIAGVNLFFSYVVTALFAMPLVCLAKRFRLINYVSLVGIGVVSGFLVSLFFSSTAYGVQWDSMNTLGVGIGFAGGVVYCVAITLLYWLDTRKAH